MPILSRLSDTDLNKVKDAVAQAESKISGEIMPVLVEQSHHYPAVKWKSAALLGIACFMALVVADRWAPDFAIYDPAYYFLIVAGAGVIGALIPVWFPSIKRYLVSEPEQKHAARQKAETIFLQEEVFNTRQRTGIMIFISFLEHEVIVMGDKGINSKVEQSEWDELTGGLVKHIKDGGLIQGLEQAIAQCGDLLLKKGFVREADDINELSDHLRTS